MCDCLIKAHAGPSRYCLHQNSGKVDQSHLCQSPGRGIDPTNKFPAPVYIIGLLSHVLAIVVQVLHCEAVLKATKKQNGVEKKVLWNPAQGSRSSVHVAEIQPKFELCA